MPDGGSFDACSTHTTKYQTEPSIRLTCIEKIRSSSKRYMRFCENSQYDNIIIDSRIEVQGKQKWQVQWQCNDIAKEKTKLPDRVIYNWTRSLSTHHAGTTHLALFNDSLLLVGFGGQLTPLMPLHEITRVGCITSQVRERCPIKWLSETPWSKADDIQCHRSTPMTWRWLTYHLEHTS